MVTSLLFDLFSSSFVSPHSLSVRRPLSGSDVTPDDSIPPRLHLCFSLSTRVSPYKNNNNNLLTPSLPSSHSSRTWQTNFLLQKCNCHDFLIWHQLAIQTEIVRHVQSLPPPTLVTSGRTEGSCCTCTFYMKARGRERERTAVNHFCFYDHNFFFMFREQAVVRHRLQLYFWVGSAWFMCLGAAFCPLLPFVAVQLQLSSSLQQCSFLQSPLGDSVIYYFFIILAVRPVIMYVFQYTYTFKSCFESLHPSAMKYSEHKYLREQSAPFVCRLSSVKGPKVLSADWCMRVPGFGIHAALKRKVWHKYYWPKQHCGWLKKKKKKVARHQFFFLFIWCLMVEKSQSSSLLSLNV